MDLLYRTRELQLDYHMAIEMVDFLRKDVQRGLFNNKHGIVARAKWWLKRAKEYRLELQSRLPA